MGLTVKVEHHGGKKRHVEIPGDWFVVTSGPVHNEDMFYNLAEHKFTRVEDDDVGNDVSEYALIIRTPLKHKKK